jgi:nuclease HARBI1
MDELYTDAIAAAFAVIILFSNLCINVLAVHELQQQQQCDNSSWAAQELLRRRHRAAQRRRERRTQRTQPYRPPLEYNRIPWTLDELSDNWVKAKLRFSRDEFYVILPLLRLDEIDWARDGNRYKPSQEKVLAVILFRLSWPTRLQEAIETFRISRSQISTIFNVAVTFLSRRFQSILFFDRQRLTMNKMREYATAISAHGGTDSVWAFVDGTDFEICRPTDNQRLCYSGHKKKHCLKFQAAVTPDGLISSLCGPIVGRHGDWHMFQRTGIEEEVFDLWRREGITEDNRLYLYGDPAYCGSDTVIGAFKRPRGGGLSSEQALINSILSASRMAVEHSFGIVQRTFEKGNFSSTLRINSSPVGSYYSAAVLLTNIQTCLRGNQISSRFSIAPPEVAEYLGQ